MNVAAHVWLVIFAVAGVMFFAIAALITILGVRDLRFLLARSNRRSQEGKPE
jgi:hypothetical protein